VFWQLEKAVPRSALRLVVGLATGLMFGLAAGNAFGIAAGLHGVPSDIAEAVGPRMVLVRDRQALLFFIAVVGVAAGIAFGLMMGARVRLVAGTAVGIAAGPVIGLMFGPDPTRWMSYTFARGWLAFRGQLPWPLMAFLADAHQRGILRQARPTSFATSSCSAGWLPGHDRVITLSRGRLFRRYRSGWSGGRCGGVAGGQGSWLSSE
jgi:hypothetical protein